MLETFSGHVTQGQALHFVVNSTVTPPTGLEALDALIRDPKRINWLSVIGYRSAQRFSEEPAEP